MATHAHSTLAGLQILANSICGLSITNTRLLYKTVILPVLTFMSPVWYIRICQKTLIKPLEQAQAAGLRWILGTFCTTLFTEMHHIGVILLIPQLLHWLSSNSATHLHTLPLSFQVLARALTSWKAHNSYILVSLPRPCALQTILATIIHHLTSLTSPKYKKTLPYYTPPWDTQHHWGVHLLLNTPAYALSKKEANQHTKSLALHILSLASSDSTLLIYTDSSCHKANNSHSHHHHASAGYAIILQGQEIKSDALSLSKHTSTYDTEMFVLTRGAMVAQEITLTCPNIQCIIFVTNNLTTTKIISTTLEHIA